MYDLLGYVAMLVTILSMVFSNENKFRIINSIGCVLWILYGIVIHSNPNTIVNAIILAIHIRKLNFSNSLTKN